MVLGLVCALSVPVMAQEAKAGKVDVVDFGEGVKLEMVLVPAGKFKMGFTKKELVDFQEELKKELGKEELDLVDLFMSFQGKQHEVTLTKPFYIGKYEVTQEQWEAVMGKNPSRTKGAKLPVTHVSWEDCQEFIKKLNAKTNGGYRLPTESEWEYACRAGTTTAYSFGDEITPKDANYQLGKPVAVGNYKPNAFGLYDLHGNVWEWCEDWHGEYPFAVTDPKGAATGNGRVMRGGSFLGTDSFARSSNQLKNPPTYRGVDLGFRLARTADSKGSVASLTKTRPDPVETIPATGNRLVAPFSEAKNDKAIADYTRDIKLDPKSAFAYNKRGFTYIKLKQYDKAIADFNRAIELDPKLAVAYNNRGNTYVELKQYNKAIADCTKAIELDPEWLMAYNNWGDAYLGLQQYDKAIADCTKAIELDPKSAVAYNNRGVAYLGLQQYEKAIPECNKAIDLDPKLAVAYSNRGNAYGELEQYEKAITNCTKAIELDPNLAVAYGHRGFAYIKLKQYDKVIADYSRAIELDPKLPFANGFRGVAYFVLPQYDKAIADFSRAIELDPKSATTYNFRGTAYLKVGKKKEAEEDFAKEKMLMGN
jgi:formylglycine-generating enzyme required for sulfatase activity/Flp pilus assembly protein TadD